MWWCDGHRHVRGSRDSPALVIGGRFHAAGISPVNDRCASGCCRCGIYISTLETQKNSRSHSISPISRKTKDYIQPKTAISRPIKIYPISHLFNVVWVRFQRHIVPQQHDFQHSEHLGQLVLQVAILFLCGLHHEIFMPSLRDLCV